MKLVEARRPRPLRMLRRARGAVVMHMHLHIDMRMDMRMHMHMHTCDEREVQGGAAAAVDLCGGGEVWRWGGGEVGRW